MKKFISLILFIITGHLGFTQTDTAFWFAAPDVSSAFNYDRPILFRISSYQQAATVQISQPANSAFPVQTITLPPYTTQSVDLTTWITLVECAPGNIVQNKGLKITSNSRIAVYYEVNANGPNPELFALKGKNAIGTQFYISSQYLLNNTATHNPTPYSSFNIIASEDNTTVTIIPTAGIVGHAANVPFNITLNRGQTYAAIATSTLAAQHLQGSKVTSTKPIAITLSDDLLQGIAYGGICEDLAGDQTVPVSVIGNEYIAFKSNLNSPYDKVYITATQNSTAVSQDGVLVTTLNSGQSASLSVTGNTTYIQTSFPAYAYQLSGISCEVGSAILPKITCTGSSSVSVTRSTNENFIITLLVRSGGQSGFLINNTSGIITAAQFSVVPFTSGQWYWAKITLPISSYPNGSVIKIDNTANVFQLGVLQGGTASGAAFGYFSDYNTLQANATTQSNSVCIGSSILLFADTISSATYNWTGPNSFTSNQQNPVINNSALINSGNYYLNVTVPNCGTYADTLYITVKPKTFQTINQSICEGQSYLGYTTTGTFIDTLTGTNGCDSIRTLNLIVKSKSFSSINAIICEGQIFSGHTTSGVYNDTLVAVNGCDSIRTTNLIVKPRSLNSISQTICQGQNYLGYFTSGIYIDTLVAANGCDSIRTINLTVKPRSIITLNQSICQGQSYLGHTITGVYIDTLVAANGCDSIRTINLTVKPKTFQTLNPVICSGQSFAGYTVSGTYIDTLIGSNGCDSIRTINLTIKPVAFFTTDQTICQGQSYYGHTTTGTYIDTLVAFNGCDSIRTAHLQVTPASFLNIDQIICQGQSYLGHTVSGIYKDTLVSANGCDSITTLHLSVLKAPSPELGPGKEICIGDTLILNPGTFINSTYLWNTNSNTQQIIISQAGIYSVTVSNICGAASDQITIIESSCDIYVPNTFTPNNDGSNDVFEIIHAKNLKEFRFIIYNRWGEKVFETTDPLIGWDGKVKNMPADMGNYVWYCTYKKSNIPSRIKGTVLLLR